MRAYRILHVSLSQFSFHLNRDSRATRKPVPFNNTFHFVSAVTCGTPSRISHGHFVGNSFNYGNEVTYICDNGYNMTTPSRAKQTCTQWGYWRGTTAKCQCASVTLLHENICVNMQTCDYANYNNV